MTADFKLQPTADALEARIRANRLLSLPAAWADEIVFPHYGGLSIYNLAQSVAHVLGVDLPNPAPLDDAVWGGDSPVGQVDRVVMFLSDGLGYRWLRRFMDDDLALRQAVADLSEGRGPLLLTSVTPSTTAAALTTLWTGHTPIAHGIVGLTMFLREFSMQFYALTSAPPGKRFPENTFAQWGLNPDTFIPVEGLAAALQKAGVPTHLLLDYRLIDTGLSRLLHRGVSERHLHVSFSDFWLRLGDTLRATAGQRCVVSVYWPAVDALAHLYGADTPYLRAEVRQQFEALTCLLADERVRDGRTLFLFLADHGHYDVSQFVDLSRYPQAGPVRAARRCGMSGEGRLPYLNLLPAGRDEALEALSRDFAALLYWVDARAAAYAGLFGPETPYAESLHRLGDVVLIPRLGYIVIDSPAEPSVSAHGGLADWEMLVPFIWKRL
ncbi:MAG: alkaline phosphatase family protein [Aggregatilineales bacterium]